MSEIHDALAKALRDSHYQLSRKTAEKLSDTALAVLGVTSNEPLRGRLIKVLHDDGARPASTAAELADRVIAAMGLTKQTINCPSGLVISRWVTIWEK